MQTKIAFTHKCRNMHGPLDPDTKARLAELLNNPTNETWDNAFSMIVGADGWTSLWEAWTQVDPNAPRAKPCNGHWPRIPDQLTIYRALRHVTRAR